MIIREIQNIDIISKLHVDIFGKAFPIESYYKKCKNHRLYIFIYEQESTLIGYSIIVDQEQEKNMYAWYGGVKPNFQGNGVTAIFLDYLIEFARKKGYCSVTLASTNQRPHMLRLAIKMGFDIDHLKIRTEGEGNKIYFRYNILPPHTEEICLYEKGKMLKPVDIESKLVCACKKNSQSIILNYDGNKDALIFAIKYCNSFFKKPKLLIATKVDEMIDFEIKKAINQYQGKIKIIK